MQRLESQILYDGKWRFCVDKVILPSGLGMEMAYVDHPGSIVLVPILDEKILMIEQFRPVLDQTILELPAGTLEVGENRLLGAQRELREETGYRAATLTPLGTMLPSPGATNEVMHILLASDLTWDPLPMDEDESIQLRPLALAELLPMALTGEIPDAKSVVGILRANHYLSVSAETSS